MTALDIMALFSLAMMVVMFVGVFVFLGSLPGRIAKKRGHPNAKAVLLGGWATLILAVVGWPFVLMWAMADQHPKQAQEDASGERPSDGLEQQLLELTQRLAAVESKLK
jgi:hypothetical protein